MYRAESELTASWRISRVALEEIQSLEVSVLWHTEGKGDEDLHVHQFLRVSEQKIRRAGILEDQSLKCVLPSTPLSYRGRLVSLCWCVRLRLYLNDGREIVTEQPFYLVSADFPTPCAASPPEDASAKLGRAHQKGLTSSQERTSSQQRNSPQERVQQLVGSASRLS